MKRIELAKYGFVRCKEDDFSDDGNRFTCYRVGKVRVSKLVSDGEAYIHASIDDYLLPYETYSQLPHYRYLSDLNGVSVSNVTEEDLQKLYEDCISYEKEYDDAYNSIKWPSEKEIADKASEFFAEYVKVYNQLEEELRYNMLTIANRCSSYEWSSLRDYIRSFRNAYEQYSDPDDYGRRLFKNITSLEFVKKTPNVTDNFWAKQIRKIIEQYSD
jgi:hypothetical protein